jgi:hypothetical protein
MVKYASLLALLAACGSFEDPDIVLDFRVLAMRAEIPEQVVDIDITQPPDVGAVLAQLVDTKVCPLLSDRNFDRDLRWSAQLCDLTSDDRCPEDAPVLGSGVWTDPDTTNPDMCITVPANGNLIGVALDYLEGDQLKGLGGIYYGVSLRVGGVGANPDLDLFAAKNLRLNPRIPAELKANNNPSLDGLEVSVNGGEAMPLALGRCIDQPSPLVLAPGDQIRLNPLETAGAREEYVVPTVTGGSRMFTESLTYQWLATAGNYSSGRTGGPRDPFGNPALLYTDWTAPRAKNLDGPTDVEIWVIQRDERLGLQWYQSCVRVVPSGPN